MLQPGFKQDEKLVRFINEQLSLEAGKIGNSASYVHGNNPHSSANNSHKSYQAISPTNTQINTQTNTQINSQANSLQSFPLHRNGTDQVDMDSQLILDAESNSLVKGYGNWEKEPDKGLGFSEKELADFYIPENSNLFTESFTNNLEEIKRQLEKLHNHETLYEYEEQKQAEKILAEAKDLLVKYLDSGEIPQAFRDFIQEQKYLGIKLNELEQQILTKLKAHFNSTRLSPEQY